MTDQIREAVEWMEMQLDAGLMTDCAEYDAKVWTVLAALSHETERADLLQAAVLERIAERDALAERVRVLEGALKAVLEVRVYGHDNIWAGGNRCKDIAKAALSPSPLVEGGR